MTDQATVTDDLDAALLSAQAAFKEIPKDKINKFYDNAGYSSLDAIISATRPGLLENKLLMTHDPEDTENGIRVTAILKHIPSKQSKRISLSCDCGRNDPQKIGKAITYLRKYTIFPLLGIAPDEDDDGNGAIPDDKRREAANGKTADRTPAKSSPAATTRSAAKPNLSMPVGWPDTDVTNLCNWINSLAPTTPAFKTAFGILTSNAGLYSSVDDWEPVLQAFTNRLRTLIMEKKIPQKQRDAVFEEQVKAECEKLANDKASAAAFADPDPTPGTESTDEPANQAN